MDSTPSTLTDFHREIAIDASVIINLLGSGEAESILTALRRPVYVTNQVLSEVIWEPRSGQPASTVLTDLIARGLLVRKKLDYQATIHMVALTGAPGQDALDDGEAATIALGAQFGCAVVIDEARGRRIAATVPIVAGILGTLDLMTSPNVITALGVDRVRSLIVSACRHSRMRVPSELCAWVVRQIGEPVARELPGLNRHFRRTRG